MNNMGILHNRLHDRLWHMTHPERFQAILSSASLHVEPDIPNSERWKATQAEYYPFVRYIGGISLFDFSGFDPESYEKSFPMSNWYEFVPHLSSWGGAVWIEIDRLALDQSFISAEQLRVRWDQNGLRKHTRMPQIEAAHIGNMPSSAFRSAFLTWDKGRQVRDVALGDHRSLNTAIKEWRAAITSVLKHSE